MKTSPSPRTITAHHSTHGRRDFHRIIMPRALTNDPRDLCCVEHVTAEHSLACILMCTLNSRNIVCVHRIVVFQLCPEEEGLH